MADDRYAASAPSASCRGLAVDVVSGAARGVVGAMAMTGMRVITTELGLVEQTAPEAMSRQHARGLRNVIRRVAHRRGSVLLAAVLVSLSAVRSLLPL